MQHEEKVCGLVVKCVQNGWPDKGSVTHPLSQYFAYRDFITL